MNEYLQVIGQDFSHVGGTSRAVMSPAGLIQPCRRFSYAETMMWYNVSGCLVRGQFTMPQSMLGVEGEPPAPHLTLLLGDDSERQAGRESHWNQTNVTKSLSGRLVRSYVHLLVNAHSQSANHAAAVQLIAFGLVSVCRLVFICACHLFTGQQTSRFNQIQAVSTLSRCKRVFHSRFSRRWKMNH